MALKNIRRSSLLILILVSMLVVTVSAAVYYSLIANLAFDAEVSPVIFSNGDDTVTPCGGSLTTQATQVAFTAIPLAVESNITITELVNVTNSDASAHDVLISVSGSSFAGELSTLSLYLVSPSATETLIIQLDDSGAVTTEDVTVSIPASEVYAIKLVGCYDEGTLLTQTNTLDLALQVTD